MNEILLKIITFLHVLFIMFIVIIPFTNSTYLLLLHAITVPFLILHWICNNNVCVLTLIEKNLRMQMYGTVDEKECFTCRLIEPIYDFGKNYEAFTVFIYIFTISLWCLSVYKLYSKYQTGKIKNFNDLFVL